jgi:hypothetical protein
MDQWVTPNSDLLLVAISILIIQYSSADRIAEHSLVDRQKIRTTAHMHLASIDDSEVDQSCTRCTSIIHHWPFGRAALWWCDISVYEHREALSAVLEHSRCQYVRHSPVLSSVQQSEQLSLPVRSPNEPRGDGAQDLSSQFRFGFFFLVLLAFQRLLQRGPVYQP